MKKTLSHLVISVALLIVACEGPVGPIGLKSLMNILNEPAGSNCQYGGLKIESGIDENVNELLESNEIDITNFVCNGQPGNNGSKSLLKTTPEVSETNCPTGGYRVDSGIDLNSNDVLDAIEIQSTTYLCNGLFDEVTVLDFGYNTQTTSSNWTIATYPGRDLYNFNITNYPGVDSVVFMAFLGTENITSKCFVDLFNKTDNEPITNSLLESNRLVGPGFVFPPPYEMKHSGNIYSHLPKKDITLTFRTKSEVEGIQVTTGALVYLYLYKK